MMMIFTVYKNSALATMESIFGSAFCAAGIMGAISGEIPALTLLPLGAALLALAARTSRKKSFRKWVKLVREKGIEAQIRSDLNLALSVYRTNPCEDARKYIASLNPEAGRHIG